MSFNSNITKNSKAMLKNGVAFSLSNTFCVLCCSVHDRKMLKYIQEFFSKGENTNKTLTFLCYNRGIKAKKRPSEDENMFKILIVEDDRDLNRSVCSFLNNSGYEAVGCLDAESAYDEMYKTTFDCIVSDIMMPNIDGFEFAKTVRSLDNDIPILFMTARDDFASKQRGYRIGIDDYMTKPIDLDELFLRIGALLRRSKIAASRRIEVGNFVMDADERSATLNGEEISLTAREFDLLYKLLSYPKKTFTRTQLMDEFWDVDTQTSTRTVDVYMTKLRAKLSECDSFEIQTVHGLGYKAVIK